MGIRFVDDSEHTPVITKKANEDSPEIAIIASTAERVQELVRQQSLPANTTYVVQEAPHVSSKKEFFAGEEITAGQSRTRAVMLALFHDDTRLTDEDAHARFCELSARHPHIATTRVTSTEPENPDDDPQTVVVMDLGEEDLNSAFSRFGEEGMAMSDMLSYLIQTASAIEATHAEGLVYRDLKPSNVAIVDRKVMLVDADTVTSANRELHGQRVGTKGYMAPETKRLDQCRPEEDMYAYGRILSFVIDPRPETPEQDIYCTPFATAITEHVGALRNAQQEPELRPTAHESLIALRNFQRQIRAQQTNEFETNARKLIHIIRQLQSVGRPISHDLCTVCKEGLQLIESIQAHTPLPEPLLEQHKGWLQLLMMENQIVSSDTGIDSQLTLDARNNLLRSLQQDPYIHSARTAEYLFDHANAVDEVVEASHWHSTSAFLALPAIRLNNHTLLNAVYLAYERLTGNSAQLEELRDSIAQQILEEWHTNMPAAESRNVEQPFTLDTESPEFQRVLALTHKYFSNLVQQQRRVIYDREELDNAHTYEALLAASILQQWQTDVQLPPDFWHLLAETWRNVQYNQFHKFEHHQDAEVLSARVSAAQAKQQTAWRTGLGLYPTHVPLLEIYLERGQESAAFTDEELANMILAIPESDRTSQLLFHLSKLQQGKNTKATDKYLYQAYLRNSADATINQALAEKALEKKDSTNALRHLKKVCVTNVRSAEELIKRYMKDLCNTSLWSAAQINELVDVWAKHDSSAMAKQVSADLLWAHGEQEKSQTFRRQVPMSMPISNAQRGHNAWVDDPDATHNPVGRLLEESSVSPHTAMNSSVHNSRNTLSLSFATPTRLARISQYLAEVHDPKGVLYRALELLKEQITTASSIAIVPIDNEQLEIVQEGEHGPSTEEIEYLKEHRYELKMSTIDNNGTTRHTTLTCALHIGNTCVAVIFVELPYTFKRNQQGRLQQTSEHIASVVGAMGGRLSQIELERKNKLVSVLSDYKSELQETLPTIPGVEAHVANQLLGHDGKNGGDGHHAEILPNGKALYIMYDACGHGDTATSLAREILASTKAIISLHRRKKTIHLGEISRDISNSLEPRFAGTMIFLTVDPVSKQVEYVSLGNEPPHIQGQAFEATDDNEPPPGVVIDPDTPHEVHSIPLPADGPLTIGLTTDGLAETHITEGQMLKRDGVQQIFDATTDVELADLPDAVIEGVREKAHNGEITDDLSFMVIRINRSQLVAK